MERNDFIELIRTLVESFDAGVRFELLEQRLASMTKAELSDALLECGVIPERFVHDSSEEKLWAKHGDILLAKALSALNVPAEVLRTRGDSADVFGKTADYTLVSDAKAFRLSRSAKNQKDFKVNALNAWRRTNTFACLVAPLYQYPSHRSQIYSQAISQNVLLLSYVHLRFLLDYPPTLSLAGLWGIPKTLPVSNQATDYWHAVERVILDLAGQSMDNLASYKQTEVDRNRAIGEAEIRYLENVIHDYHQLSQQEAVQRLIKAERIESRLEIIRRVVKQEIVVWTNL